MKYPEYTEVRVYARMRFKSGFFIIHHTHSFIETVFHAASRAASEEGKRLKY